MEINIDGYTYFFKKDESLDDSEFIKKCWFIAKNKPKNLQNFNDALKYSRIHYNMDTLKCKYPPEIEKVIKKYKLA